MEKETATHSSVLAWRILGTEEPGGLPSMGSHRVGHDWSDLAAAAATPNSWNPKPKPNSVPELILTVSQNKTLSARKPARARAHTHTHTGQARLIDLGIKLLAGMMAFLKEKIANELKCEAQCYVLSFFFFHFPFKCCICTQSSEYEIYIGLHFATSFYFLSFNLNSKCYYYFPIGFH